MKKNIFKALFISIFILGISASVQKSYAQSVYQKNFTIETTVTNYTYSNQTFNCGATESLLSSIFLPGGERFVGAGAPGPGGTIYGIKNSFRLTKVTSGNTCYVDIQVVNGGRQRVVLDSPGYWIVNFDLLNQGRIVASARRY